MTTTNTELPFDTWGKAFEFSTIKDILPLQRVNKEWKKGIIPIIRDIILQGENRYSEFTEASRPLSFSKFIEFYQDAAKNSTVLDLTPRTHLEPELFKNLETRKKITKLLMPNFHQYRKNDIMVFPDRLTSLPSLIESYPELTELDISSMRLDYEDILALKKVCSKLQTIKTYDFTYHENPSCKTHDLCQKFIDLNKEKLKNSPSPFYNDFYSLSELDSLDKLCITNIKGLIQSDQDLAFSTKHVKKLSSVHLAGGQGVSASMINKLFSSMDKIDTISVTYFAYLLSLPPIEGLVELLSSKDIKPKRVSIELTDSIGVTHEHLNTLCQYPFVSQARHLNLVVNPEIVKCMEDSTFFSHMKNLEIVHLVIQTSARIEEISTSDEAFKSITNKNDPYNVSRVFAFLVNQSRFPNLNTLCVEYRNNIDLRVTQMQQLFATQEIVPLAQKLVGSYLEGNARIEHELIAKGLSERPSLSVFFRRSETIGPAELSIPVWSGSYRDMIELKTELEKKNVKEVKEEK